MKENIEATIIPISAKVGTNVATLLKEIRNIYDSFIKESEKNNEAQKDTA